MSIPGILNNVNRCAGARRGAQRRRGRPALRPLQVSRVQPGEHKVGWLVGASGGKIQIRDRRVVVGRSWSFQWTIKITILILEQFCQLPTALECDKRTHLTLNILSVKVIWAHLHCVRLGGECQETNDSIRCGCTQRMSWVSFTAEVSLERFWVLIALAYAQKIVCGPYRLVAKVIRKIPTIASSIQSTKCRGHA